MRGAPQRTGRTALEVITGVRKPGRRCPTSRPTARATRPHPVASRRDQPERPCARRHDPARSPVIASRCSCYTSTRQPPCRRSRSLSARRAALGARFPLVLHLEPHSATSGSSRRLGSPPTTWSRSKPPPISSPSLESGPQPRPRARGVRDARAQRHPRPAPPRAVSDGRGCLHAPPSVDPRERFSA